ncbi:uncharacterized protein F5Z01DRAFT_651534 [Emericellopsis atlantica]|uniref:Secreted protein n=1 Tax=Emericellopsis atlantica TaxID=2614577 RepID=A0A9P7ZPY6_9HYPO|nr:uncharacterized protein F5Z01DRAFT_651534 [Emericellopsis atlantica]KAG9255560.1 hypothetical protein F5Z01DRAFT_651534 [Emericellopsis atlantica]
MLVLLSSSWPMVLVERLTMVICALHDYKCSTRPPFSRPSPPGLLIPAVPIHRQPHQHTRSGIVDTSSQPGIANSPRPHPSSPAVDPERTH